MKHEILFYRLDTAFYNKAVERYAIKNRTTRSNYLPDDVFIDLSEQFGDVISFQYFSPEFFEKGFTYRTFLIAENANIPPTRLDKKTVFLDINNIFQSSEQNVEQIIIS